MNGSTHHSVSQKAILLLAQEKNTSNLIIGHSQLTCKGVSGTTLNTNGKKILIKNSDSDHFEDLEFVDVEASLSASCGRDDPHYDNKSTINDKARYTTNELSEKWAGINGDYDFTSFQHFIDLGHKGIYDDYDGYSYRHGSASNDEYEDGFHTKNNMLIKGEFSNKGKLDADINYYFNDEYIHSPGMRWYKNCSPAAWRYTFSEDTQKTKQILKRYPFAKSKGAKDCGIPYSVFTPVDNMGRFWYERFMISGDPIDLGPVLHAIQDACVPHHASGYMGNWHVLYENCLDKEFDSYKKSCDSEVLKLYRAWASNTDAPRQSITYPGSRNWTPNKSWRIDHLITWLACQAHYQYINDYNRFRNANWEKDGEFKSNQKPRELLNLAIAMSMLVLEKAQEEYKREKATGSNLVKFVDVTLYAPKSKASYLSLIMRLYNNYCGGSIEFALLNILSKEKTINGEQYYVYHRSIDLDSYQDIINVNDSEKKFSNVNAKKFKLELERCTLKKFNFYYKITYRTDDDINHTYADTFSTKKLETGFKEEVNCLTLPRAEKSIRRIVFKSTESTKNNVQPNNAVAIAFRTSGRDSHIIILSKKQRKSADIILDEPIDLADHRIIIVILGKDAWSPSSIDLDVYDEKNNLVSSYHGPWKDYLLSTPKFKALNYREYDLIKNCKVIFNPPT